MCLKVKVKKMWEKNLKKKNHSQNITQQRGFELQFTASTQLQDPTLIQLRHYPVLAVDELKSRVNIGPQQQQQRRLFFFFRRGREIRAIDDLLRHLLDVQRRILATSRIATPTTSTCCGGLVLRRAAGLH